MKKIRNLMILAIAIASFSTLSYAGSFGVGANFAQTEVSASGTENTEGLTTDTSTRTKSVDSDALIANIYAEYVTEPFSFTSEGNGLAFGFQWTPGVANVSDAVHKRTDAATGPATDLGKTDQGGTYSAHAQVENYHNFYVELPVYGMFYAKFGLSSIDVVTMETSSNGGSYGDATLDGTNLGLGMKGKFTDNLVYKVFYEQTDFDQLKLSSTGNAASTAHELTADLDTAALGFSIGYSF